MFDDLDLRLYAIVDPEHDGGRPLPELAAMVAAGGATLIQLRDKKSDMRSQIALAKAVKAALPAHVPLLINDYIDVMLESGADGVSVISALSKAPDPTQSARDLRAVVDAALAQRAPVVPDTRDQRRAKAQNA